MLIQEVDAIGSKAFQHRLDHPLDMFRAAIESRQPLACFHIDVPAEFRCNHDFVPKGSHAFTKNTLHLKRTVRFSRIEESNAMIEGGTDDVDHFGPVRHGGFILAAHVLDTETDARHLEHSEFAVPNT